MTVKSSTTCNSPSGLGGEGKRAVKYFLSYNTYTLRWNMLLPTRWGPSFTLYLQSHDQFTLQVVLQAVTILVIKVNEKTIGDIRNFPNRLRI